MRLLLKLISTFAGSQIFLSNLGYTFIESMTYALFISSAICLLSEISDKLSEIIKHLNK